MIAEAFAVIRDDDERRRTWQSIERLNEPAELLVHRRHLAEVRILDVLGAERLGRCVGRVRIVVVDPHEARLCRRTIELRDGRIGRLTRRSLG